METKTCVKCARECLVLSTSSLCARCMEAEYNERDSLLYDASMEVMTLRTKIEVLEKKIKFVLTSDDI